QSAMDALRVQVPRRFIAGGEVGDRLFRHWSRDRQKRNLPRFRMSLGSSAILTARMLYRSVGIGPQALMWWRVSEGQRSTAMLTSRGKRLRNPETVLTKLTRSEEHTSELQSLTNK